MKKLQRFAGPSQIHRLFPRARPAPPAGRKSLSVLAASIAVLLASTGVSHAQNTYIWTGESTTNSSNWTDSTNWTNGPSTGVGYPSVSGDNANFSSSAATFGPSIIGGTSIPSTITVDSITFASSATQAFTLTVDGSSGTPATLTLDTSTGVVNSSNFTQLFLINGNGTNTNGTNTATLTLSNGATAGTNTTYTLTNGGAVYFTDTANGTTTSSIVNNGGTFDISKVTSGAVTVGSISDTGTAGNYYLGGNTLTTTVPANTVSTVNGVIQDGGLGGGAGGSLVVNGAGTLALNGVNTYTGSTTVSNGALLVNGSLAGGGAVNVNAGTLGGTGSITGTVTIASGADLTPGTGSAPGTLTVGPLVLNTGANLNYQLASAGTVGMSVNSLTMVNGPLTLAGTLNITALPGFGDGTYEIIEYTGTLTNNNLVVGTSTAQGYNYTIDTSTTGEVNLDVTSNGQTIFWNGGNGNTPATGTINGGNGTWNNTFTNWTDASGTVAGTYNGMNAVFQATAGTVTLGANITFTTLEFNTTGYVINPNGFTMTPASGSTITVSSGLTATINAPMVGAGSIALSGGGTLNLGGTNTYSGATTVSAGTLQAGASGGFSPSSAFTVNSPGMLDINGFSPTIGSLAGTGAVINNGATAGTLITGNDGTSTTFSGVITNGTSALTLTKIGAGVLTLTGANSYSGGTNLTNGGLLLNDTPASGVTSAIGTGPLTISNVAGGTTLLGSATNNITIANNVVINGDFSISSGAATSSSPSNIFFSSTVDLDGQTHTITGLTAQGQVNFGGQIISSTGTGGINFLGVSSSYTAFIYNGSVANTYTGLTTVGSGAFLVLEQSSVTEGAVIGPVLINAGGSLDLLASEQTAPNITVTVNSSGINISGSQFQGFELQTFSDTIGTLNGTSAGTVGIGTGSLTVSNGNFAGNIVDSVTTGTISALEGGATYGALNVVGPGILNLSGVNTYQAATNVTGGTLQAGSSTGFSPNSAFTVSSPATLDVNGFSPTVGSLAGTGLVTNNSTTPGTLITGLLGTSTAFTGVLQDGIGSLGLLKTGVGIFTVSTSTYSGATTVIQGTLQAATTTAFSPHSSYTILAPGALDLNGFNNSIGSLGGSGTVTNLGAKPVVLTTGLDNTNSNFGGTIQDGNSTIALVKTGTGAMTLSSPNTFSGGTVLQSGTLIVDSVVALGSGNMTVTGGALQGGGTATDIEVGGNYKQTGGELDLRIGGTEPGTFDRLAVVGSATLGGRLSVSSFDGFLPPRRSEYIIISAGGGVNGTFQQVTGNLANNPLLSLTVEYLPDEVILAFGGTNFSGIPGLTPNEKAVAKALDLVTLNARANKLLNYIEALPVKGLPAAFDRIAPEEYGTIYQISTSAAKDIAITVENRLDAIHAHPAAFGPGGPVGSPDPDAPIPQPFPVGVYANATGDFVSIGNSYNAAGYNFDSGGVTVGADYLFSENFVAGALFNYTRTRADLTERGRLDADGFRGGVYASLFGGGAYVNAYAGAGYNDYNMQRTGLNTPVSGSTSGGEFNGLIQTGYDAHRGPFTFGPVGSLQYTYTGLSSLQEQGSLDPLNISSAREQSIRSNIGARATYEWHFGRYILAPELRATWQHEFGNVIDSTTAGMVLGSPSFTVTSAPIGRDSLLLNAGFTLTIAPRVSAYLFYDGELARINYQESNLLMGVRTNF